MGVDDVVFEYSLLGDAWYRAEFRIGDQHLDVTVGDSPDPLEELMEGALKLVRGQSTSEPLLWDPEDDGEYRWHLTPAADQLHIRVTYDVRYPAGGERDRSRVVFDAACPVQTFCSAVSERAVEVINRYGPEKFEQLSFSPFPYELLTALQVAVARAPTE